MSVWKSFFKEMEKIAIPIGPTMIGGLTAFDISSRVKENKQKSMLTNIQDQADSMELQSPNQEQFRDDKRLSMDVARPPLS
jgi:hypothetical protein